MSIQELQKTIQDVVKPGKGILAADESNNTIAKRFQKINVESTEENRRAYRELLFSAPKLGDYISGVILYDETIRQKAADGTPLPQLLSRQGIVPGIKVDKGIVPLSGSLDENMTQGLDGLAERLIEYKQLGARFAKWRAVLVISDQSSPSCYAIRTNMQALARYASICQAEGIVPIVEPELLMDGSHSIERCEKMTERTLRRLFHTLNQNRVLLEGMILKPSMVISGNTCSRQASSEEVALATLRVLRRTVPAAVPGIHFLSGGQSDEVATEHLNLMNHQGQQPWVLSFSYGRALQASALKAWQGKKENVALAQQALLKRAKLNSAASLGKYDKALEAKKDGALV